MTYNRNIFLLIFSLFIFLAPALAQEETPALVAKAKYLGKSKPMRDMAEGPALKSSKKSIKKANLPKKVIPNYKRRFYNDYENPEALPKGEDPVWQKSFKEEDLSIIEPDLNINGLNESTGQATPPDPTGAIGKDHYIQMVNATFYNVYDKQGNLVAGPFNMSGFWSQFNRVSGGDPIVLYDQGKERWFFSEFPSNQDFLLIAVSDTSDPLGTWTAYEFPTPSFPDYPKYGLWDDAIVLTTNEFFGGGIAVYAIERDSLMAGATDVNIVRTTVPRQSNTRTGFQVLAPINWSGNTVPEPGTKPSVMRIADDAWGNSPLDKLEIWSLNIDWTNPAATTISKSADVFTQPFDSYPCAAETGGFACIPQPGNNGVDGQVEIVMNQVHYRNFGTHETIVCNFIADASAGNNHSGIRWFELRKSGTDNWTVYQEGNYAPDDKHRYMGGIAIDAAGNIGLGFNLSDEDTFPSLAYTGRRAGDPLGQMTVQEFRAVTGNGRASSRFGDYAQMTVDPENERSFWFTGEYMIGNTNWGTRIFSFTMQDTTDLSLTNLESPMSAIGLTSNEDVIVRVQNIGIDSVMQFDLSYSLDGAAFYTESVDTFLRTGDIYVHNFAQDIDLSALGDHELICAVHNTADNNEFNDTLVTTITNYFDLDIGVKGISLDKAFSCDEFVEMEIVVSNYAPVDVSSFRVYILHDAVIVDSVDWTGVGTSVLAFQEDVIINYSLSGLNVGDNIISAQTAMPNGTTDQNTTNDNLDTQLEVLADAVNLTLNLQLDFYPDETSWEITDAQGNELYTGGSYTQMELIQIDFCGHPDSCYIFTIFDSSSDGLTGDFGVGLGDYSITDDQGNVFVNMDEVNFGSIEIHDFCAGCTLGANVDIAHSNGNDGVIMIEALNGVAPFMYSIDGGTNFQDSNTFENLSVGFYDLVIIDQRDCTYETEVEVSVFSSTSNLDLEPVVKVYPNPTQGLFRVELSNVKLDEQQLEIEILDLQGKVVMRGMLNRFNDFYTCEVSILTYPSGNYLLRFVNKDLKKLVKLVKE